MPASVAATRSPSGERRSASGPTTSIVAASINPRGCSRVSVPRQGHTATLRRTERCWLRAGQESHSRQCRTLRPLRHMEHHGRPRWRNKSHRDLAAGRFGTRGAQWTDPPSADRPPEDGPHRQLASRRPPATPLLTARCSWPGGRAAELYDPLGAESRRQPERGARRPHGQHSR
jgi:hypothetical protein